MSNNLEMSCLNASYSSIEEKWGCPPGKVTLCREHLIDKNDCPAEQNRKAQVKKDMQDCAKKWGCPPERAALCQTEFVDDCPLSQHYDRIRIAEYNKREKERCSKLEHQKRMTKLGETYYPYLRRIYRGFMRGIAWLLLLPFPERKDDR